MHSFVRQLVSLDLEVETFLGVVPVGVNAGHRFVFVACQTENVILICVDATLVLLFPVEDFQTTNSNAATTT